MRAADRADALGRVHALWDRLAGYGAAETDKALDSLFAGLMDLLNAQQCSWVGIVRLFPSQTDPVQGWRPACVRYAVGGEEPYAKFEASRRQVESGRPDQTAITNICGAGRFRVNLLRELVPPDWFEGAYYRSHYAPQQIRDAMFLAMPVTPDVESWIVALRQGEDAPHFTEADRALFAYALRPSKWLHRQLVLRHGLKIAGRPLSRPEQRLIPHLLGNLTEREIADRQHLSPATIHTYATSIYRKFGVRGRLGLLALWLGESTPKR